MLRNTILGALLALGTAFPAMAATINFTSSGSNGATGTFDGVTYVVSALAKGFAGVATPKVTQTNLGLGVESTAVDGNPNLVDGNPGGTSESLLITFSSPVNLIRFALRELDSDDDFNLFIDGVLEATYGPGESNPFDVNKIVTSFRIQAVGTGTERDDEFSFAGFEATAVPLPAAALMLLTAVGGFAVARRVKRA